jgi:hypothetical protein
VPEKPFTGFTEKLTAELAAPWAMEIELDDRLRVKSGAGGSGGVATEDEPPQPAQTEPSERRNAAGTP